MVKYIIPLLIGTLSGGFIAWNTFSRVTVQEATDNVGAALRTFQAEQLNPTYSDGECLTTDANGDLSWDTCGGGGGGGSGNVATSTADTDTYITYFTSNNATPATIGGEAAFTYDDATNLFTFTNGSSTDLTVSGNLWGDLTGNADTATALAANGANCSSGNAPLGVDASGAVESCFDVWTESENTSAAYIALTDLSASYPINYNSGTGAFTWEGLSTTTPWTAGYIVTVSDDDTVTSSSTLSSAYIEDAYVLNTGDTMTGGLTFSGVATDITTVTNEDLVLDPAGAGTLTLRAGGGGVDILTNAGNSDITLNPHGSGDVVLSDLSNAVLSVDGSGNIIASTTISDSYIASTIARDSELHDAVTLSGTPNYLTLAGQEITLGTVDISDDTNLTAGTGATLTGDSLSVDLGTAIDTTEITNDTILEVDLDVTNAPTDNYVLTYDSGSGGFTWVEQSSGSGSVDGGWATTTDSFDEAGETVTYTTNDVFIGGSASNTAAFAFDPEQSRFILSSTTASAGTITVDGADIIDSTSGNATLDFIDTLGSVAEATIESALDTLTNVTSLGTVTVGTWAADLAADTVDAIGEIASSLRSGTDATLVTGTAGTDQNLVEWDANGDAIDSGIAAANVPLLDGESDYTGTHDFDGATVAGMQYYPAFTYSTTSWSGTTTLPLGPAYNAQTWAGVKCFTDVGTLNLFFEDGTNDMDLVVASTTVNGITLSTNNTFTSSEKRYVTVGSPVSSPTEISCTVDYQDD